MPRGLPDYYNPDTLVSQRLANVEEVVTILQGVANLDNRGRVLTFEHFAEGLYNWELSSGGDGIDPVACINKALIAPASMWLNVGTDTGGGNSNALKTIIARTVEKAGLEFSFEYQSATPKIMASLTYIKGSTLYQGTVTIDSSIPAVQITDDDTPTTVLTLPSTPVVGEWLSIKLVIDFENSAYDRLLIGLTQFDISAYTLPTSAGTHDGYLRTQFLTDAVDDGANDAYIGHVTITIDEP